MGQAALKERWNHRCSSRFSFLIHEIRGNKRDFGVMLRKAEIISIPYLNPTVRPF